MKISQRIAAIAAQERLSLGFGEGPEAGLLVEALRPRRARCKALDLPGGDGGDAVADFHRHLREESKSKP
jgi:hypothetical protein